MPYPNDNSRNIVLMQTSASADSSGKFPFTERIISGSNLFILTDANGNLTGSTSIPGGSFTNLTVTGALTASIISASNSITAAAATFAGPVTMSSTLSASGGIITSTISASSNVYVSGSLTVVGNDGCSLSRTTNISCNATLTSYQTYVMGAEVFNIESPTKFGILQMLNEGFYDLTIDNTGCDLVSATFTAKVSVTPLDLTTSETFYTSTSLGNVPDDNLYYDTITQLLLSIPGIGNVIVNPLDNVITIETAKGNDTLIGQEIVIDLIIEYDIICLT